MKYENRFWYSGNGLRSSIVKDNSIEGRFIGQASEYNPIDSTTTHFNNPLCLVIRRTINHDTESVRPVNLPGFRAGRVGGYHSSEFNCNGGFSLSKKEVQQIVDVMADEDEFLIVAPDSINWNTFDKGVREVTKNRGGF